MITTVFNIFAAGRVASRRARNLRSGEKRRARTREPASAAPSWRAPKWAVAAGLLFVLSGAAVIVTHGRLLAQESVAASDTIDSLRSLLPGQSFQVPAQPGISLVRGEHGTLLVAAGMQPQGQVQVDLCGQMLDPARPRLLPVRIGYSFPEVARLAGASQAPLRAVVLATPGSALPRIEIGGTASANFANGPGNALAVNWNRGTEATSWVGDAGPAGIVAGSEGKGLLRQDGWLVLNSQGALRVRRRASQACPQAGELLLELYRAAPRPGRLALVAGFPMAGNPVTLRLPAGQYTVPSAAPPAQEDRALFDQLQAYKLVRLRPDGLAELAPPDLAAWRAAPPASRAAQLEGWDGPALDAHELSLLDRLYHKADGDYVREQVRIFNAERRLLAVRLRSGLHGARWEASVGGAPVNMTETMPAGAARLFDSFPQGWGGWQRVGSWPAGGAAQLVLKLPAPAAPGAVLELLAAGRLEVVRGGSVRTREDACSGRACPAPGAAQRLMLDLDPGARRIVFAARPMDAAGLTDPQYRHLRVSGGRLEWQALAQASPAARPAQAQVALSDRHGAPLWAAGKASAAAAKAGLGPLLGLQPGHASSVAGMLARLPSPSGRPHEAKLTLDLGLQASAQAALECVGMRRGRWDGHVCSGGAAAPAGRQAGLVVLDTETGDILAAAGAGMPAVGQHNWDEVLDFDRTDPAASPLRLPAFQHDGGSRRSPGSTFKIITALGLELAAQRDRELDALIDGVPLAALDTLAQAKGYPFRSDSASYPAHTSRAHITNFHGELIGPFSANGRIGLVQAMAHSLNTWFAWTSELSDRSLLGQPEGGVPGLQALEPGAIGQVRPVAEMAAKVGFGHALRLDGGLLPDDYPWATWDALQATPAHIDPIRSRHELRQMAIGLRMQATPLQMALAAGAVGQGRVVVPRLLYQLDGRTAANEAGPAMGVRLDRIRAGMKGVVDHGTAASAFRGARLAQIRAGLFGKTGTSLTGETDAKGRELSTVWFAGWLEPGSVPGQAHRLAFAAFVSRSEGTGGEHAAPVIAAVLHALQERAGKPPI
jgi:cell division protein FtsI/penicillin-binding protein 2